MKMQRCKFDDTSFESFNDVIGFVGDDKPFMNIGVFERRNFTQENIRFVYSNHFFSIIKTFGKNTTDFIIRFDRNNLTKFLRP